MKILLSLCLSLLLFASCSKEEAGLKITAEQDRSLESFVQELDAMSSVDSKGVLEKLIEFYEVATILSCDPGDFDIVEVDEINDYIRDMGLHSVRAFHEWTVQHGNTIRSVVKENENWDEDALVDLVITDQLQELRADVSDCEITAYTQFARKSLTIAKSFGVYVGGTGFRDIQEGQLYLFDGSFNSFVRMQESQKDCRVFTSK